MTKNIMIVGVGGQGTLLASRIIGNAVISEGHDVKISEVHGMSQRGGSVVTYVKFGDAVYSPVIDRGEADIILAFETLEAYRALPFLKKGGKIVQKTDDKDFFEFSLEEYKACGFQTENVTYNLHEKGNPEWNIVTEYESMFVAQGKPIYRLEAYLR